MILKYSALLFTCMMFVACGRKISSNLTTDLGSTGNQAVFNSYKEYLNKPNSGCLTSGSRAAHRILLSGFGLFDGVSYNISGVVVQSMANPAFWPVKNHAPTSMHPADGRLLESDHGGRAVTRAIQINGVPFEICLLSLDVKWDLAGAIIAHEVQQFRPERVIMTGRGALADTAVLEAGAVNSAARLDGFGPSGERLNDANRPVVDGGPIVATSSSANIPSILPMTWDNHALARAAAASLGNAGYHVYAESEARGNNDYICNNVSYVVLYAAQGHKFKLAGNILDIQIEGGLPDAEIGFLHLPYKASNDSASVHAIVDGIVAMIAESANGNDVNGTLR